MLCLARSNGTQKELKAGLRLAGCSLSCRETIDLMPKHGEDTRNLFPCQRLEQQDKRYYLISSFTLATKFSSTLFAILICTPNRRSRIRVCDLPTSSVMLPQGIPPLKKASNNSHPTEILDCGSCLQPSEGIHETSRPLTFCDCQTYHEVSILLQYAPIPNSF